MQARDSTQAEEATRVQKENAALTAKVQELTKELEAEKRSAKEQHDFYENALEERFAQMESFESQCEDLRRKLRDA